MYRVTNLTSRTVILSDLRVEIGPKKNIDLEQVADRDAIDKSRDLRQAFSQKKLTLNNYSTIKIKKEPTSVSESMNEEKLANIIRKVMSEEMVNKNKQNPNSNIEDTVNRAVTNSVGSLISEIRDRINGFQPNKQPEESMISTEKLAEISQKSIEKISDSITTNDVQKTKKVKIINRRLDDLADEL